MRNKILSFLAYLLIKVIAKTIGFKTINGELRERCLASGQSFIYAFWHGKQFLLLGWNKDKKLVVMASLSKDGRLQDNILTRLGFYTVTGSASRGAVRGLVGMIRGMDKGLNSCVAVDGPRGPIYEVKPGIIYLASKTNSVIIPLTARAKYRYIFNKAWDKYEFPRPFSPAVVILGEPISVPAELNPEIIEQKQLEVKNALAEITKKADSYYET